ncbi:MAG: cyanophycinase [Microcoleaceae cyanobacterium]
MIFRSLQRAVLTFVALSMSFSLCLATPAWGTTLVLVGGGWRWPATGDPNGIAIYEKVIQLARGAENAKIGIFTTAQTSAENAEASGQFYIENFRTLYPNIDVIWIPFHIGNCQAQKNSPDLVNLINSRNTFVFSGGDQALIVTCFFEENSITQTRTESKVFEALKTQYINNSVMVGTSAGTTVQAGIPMITEGESYEALLNDPVPLIGSPPRSRTLYYNPLGGFNFFTYGITDTHFSERERQGRIIRLAAEFNVAFAFGVDENTALIVTDSDTEPDTLDVIGEHGVSIFNLSAAKVIEHNGYWSISNVLMSYLTDGDQYHPQSQTVTIAPWKHPIICQNQYLILNSEQVFGDCDQVQQMEEDSPGFINLALDFFKNCTTVIHGQSSRRSSGLFEVELQKNRQINSVGYQGNDANGRNKYSFSNLEISIYSKID